MRLMPNAMAIAPKVASTPNNPVTLMNAALRWMPNFSHPGMDRIMQATGRRNIGRYRLAAMRSCRQLHRQYTANSAGLIGDQNGAYRPSVVPSTGRKAMASSSQMTLRSCVARNRSSGWYGTMRSADCLPLVCTCAAALSTVAPALVLAAILRSPLFDRITCAPFRNQPSSSVDIYGRIYGHIYGHGDYATNLGVVKPTTCKRMGFSRSSTRSGKPTSLVCDTVSRKHRG